MNIPYVGLMMLYLIPISAMLILSSVQDIKDMSERIKKGDYFVIVEKCAAPILSLGIASSFYFYWRVLMKDLIKYKFGDISIKKVSNGWMLIEGATNNEDEIMFSVYESEEKPFLDHTNATIGDAESLVRLLEDAFEAYLQCKNYGGISITLHEKGYEEDEEQLIET